MENGPGYVLRDRVPGVTSSKYDVTLDGQRFLMLRNDDVNAVSSRVVVVMNWAEELKQLAQRAASTRAAR
jgi:hypothetical protein